MSTETWGGGNKANCSYSKNDLILWNNAQAQKRLKGLNISVFTDYLWAVTFLCFYFPTINIYYFYDQKIYNETFKIQIKELSTGKIFGGKWHKRLLSSKRTYQLIKAQTKQKESTAKSTQKASKTWKNVHSH